MAADARETVNKGTAIPSFPIRVDDVDHLVDKNVHVEEDKEELEENKVV